MEILYKQGKTRAPPRGRSPTGSVSMGTGAAPAPGLSSSVWTLSTVLVQKGAAPLGAFAKQWSVHISKASVHRHVAYLPGTHEIILRHNRTDTHR